MHLAQKNLALEDGMSIKVFALEFAQLYEEESSKFPLCDITLNDEKMSWMEMTLSVLVEGWDVEEKTSTKYWIASNSYGPKWGM